MTITSKGALAHFTTAAGNWQQASLALCASAALNFLIADRDEADARAVKAELRKAVEETGLRVASAYRYVGLGATLADHIQENYEPEKKGVLQDILTAHNPNAGATAIMEFLASAEVASVDRLSVFLGAGYQRTPAPKDAGDAEEGENEGANETGAASRGAPQVRAVAAVVQASPANVLKMTREIAAQITDPELIGDIIGIWEARLDEVRRPARKRVQAGDGKTHKRRSSTLEKSGNAIHG